VSGSTTGRVLGEAARAGFELDAAQRRVLGRLDELAAGLPGEASDAGAAAPPRGVYVWGPVGRGKTWLLDAFVGALPAGTARRVHSHRFFDELHRRMHARRTLGTPGDRRRLEREVFDEAVAEFVGGAALLVFDELQVGDPGDATLMTRLLEHLDERGTALVVSSNSAPEDLLPDPVWHRVFEPGIRLILERMDVLELAGPTDYRALPQGGSGGAGGRSGFAAGAWLPPGRLAELGLEPPTPREGAVLALGGREFPVDAAREGELWVSFAALCESPLSTMEYLDWAARFGERWVVTGIPSFSRASRAAQLRFLMAVDVLCDAGVPTFLVSETPREAFLEQVRARRGAARLASRLSLLPSAVARLAPGP
jgi:cell division protein ZapE